MLFSSYEFIFIFLPAALVGYFGMRLIAGKTVTLLWLIVASLTFYAMWDPWNLLVLFSSIGFNFICGTNLAKRARAKQPTGFLLTVGVAFNLALIGYFKYSGFFATNVNAALGTNIPVLNLALPLAISFFTFQEIAYLVDSSRGETYGYRFKDYALMVVFFPHLIAGPIVNHRILMRKIMSKAELKVSAPTLTLGIGLFVFGLATKVLLADGMAPQANLILDSVARGASPGFADWRMPDSAFTDPVHLQWRENAAFTRFILNEARRLGADLPPWKEGEDNSGRDNGRKDSRTDEGGSVSGKTHRIAFHSDPIQVKHVRKANDLPDALSLERKSDSASTEQPKVTASMLEAIAQNTSGYSEGYPVGVPRNYAWCRGSYKPAGYSSPPADFTAVTGWGQVYPKAGAPAYSNPEGSIAVANARTYVHLNTTGEWILLQKQVPDSVSGAHFVSDYKRSPAVAMKLSEQTDGSVFIPSPPAGYNDHFWISKRGTYPAGAVDGVYVQMDIRTNDPNMKFVANVGADWWRDATAGYVHGFTNNPGAGMSNWVELSTQWSTLRFASWSTSRLLAEPPPPLTEGEQASALVLRRQASTSPPCISRMSPIGSRHPRP